MKRILAMSLAVSAIAAFAAFGTVGASAAPAKVTICHDTGSATHPHVELRLTERAAEAHLAHGDTRGACPGGNPPGKVLVCHKSGSTWSAILVEESAVSGHLAHGDYLGACHTTPPGGTGIGGLGKFDRRYPAAAAPAPVTQLAATR
ncbi:MAG: hypothetical protein ACKO8G_02945 [Actinomycetota bacterium]